MRMKQELIYYNGLRLYRINKRLARKLVNMGCDIYVKPHKMNANNIFCNMMIINGNTLDNCSKTFDDYVNIYQYYNCNSECGYYCDFWFDFSQEFNLNDVM